MVCLDSSKLLYIFPVIALNFGSKAPAIIYPLFTILVLYAFTYIYGKFMLCDCPREKEGKICCAKFTNKEMFIKSLAPLSIFMGLGILMYVSMFVKIPIVTGINMLLNNMITWGFLWGWLYVKLYRKTFAKVCN